MSSYYRDQAGSVVNRPGGSGSVIQDYGSADPDPEKYLQILNCFHWSRLWLKLLNQRNLVWTTKGFDLPDLSKFNGNGSRQIFCLVALKFWSFLQMCQNLPNLPISNLIYCLVRTFDFKAEIFIITGSAHRQDYFDFFCVHYLLFIFFTNHPNSTQVFTAKEFWFASNLIF
jgi:hypothetical protein